MTMKTKIKKIVLSLVVLTLTAALTYYADIPVPQSAEAVSATAKI